MAGKLELVEEALVQAVFTTLEEMSFSDVTKESIESVGGMSSDLIYASVKVNQPRPGQVVLYLPKKLAVTLTEATYGMMEEEPSLEVIHDTMGEFISTMAGCALAKILSENEIFMLDIPERGMKQAPDMSGGQEALVFSIEGEVFVVLFEGDVFK